MDWCASCKIRNSCKEVCKEVENLLKVPQPWNVREGSLTIVHLDAISSEQSDLAQYISTPNIHLRKVMLKVAVEVLTPLQLEIFHLLLEDKHPSEIASLLGKKRQTIHAAIYGSSNGRGGIVRKLKAICS